MGGERDTYWSSLKRSGFGAVIRALSQEETKGKEELSLFYRSFVMSSSNGEKAGN